MIESMWGLQATKVCPELSMLVTMLGKCQLGTPWHPLLRPDEWM